MRRLNKTIGLIGVAALSVAAMAYQAATKQLEENGNVISNNLVYENGQYLVPITDVAKYFGYQFTVSAGVGQFTKTDAANSRSQAFLNMPNGAAPPPTAPTSTDLTPVQAPPASPFPATVVPNTAITTATANLFPDETIKPSVITTTVGKDSSVNGLNYKVDSIQDSGKLYKEQFDQRAATIHPSWKTDNLAIIKISVTNTTQAPLSVYAPGTGDITVFDTQKVGIPTMGMDIRQSPDALNSDYSYDIAGMNGSTSLMLGPGGTLHYAVLASMPKGDQISSLLINVPASTSGPMSAGASITVDR